MPSAKSRTVGNTIGQTAWNFHHEIVKKAMVSDLED